MSLWQAFWLGVACTVLLPMVVLGGFLLIGRIRTWWRRREYVRTWPRQER